MQNLYSILAANPYPGRGLVIGCSQDGKAVLAYFIMGRSANSRNRVFTADDQDVYARAANTALVTDPSLILYAPVRRWNRCTIAGNGDQTDTILESLRAGKTFEEALRSRTFEPDGPIYTPRISGIIEYKEERFEYKLSILKSAGGNPCSVQRFFYEYSQPQAGVGHFIHTYAAPHDPLPSFAGEPIEVALDEEIDGFAQSIWQALDEKNKISLLVCYMDGESMQQTKIYNKYISEQ